MVLKYIENGTKLYIEEKISQNWFYYISLIEFKCNNDAKESVLRPNQDTFTYIEAVSSDGGKKN